MQGGLTATLLSVAVIAIIAAIILLSLAGIRLIRTGTDKKRGTLMLAAALVLLGNLLIWTWPLQPI